MRQTALVSGAGGGIGRALVDVLWRRNVRILATDRDEEALHRLAKKLDWPSDRVFLARLDVTSAESWGAAMAAASSLLDGLDLLFNVAGVMRAGWVHELPLDDIDTVVDVDLKGVMLGTRFAAERMVGSGGGHIINVSSMLGLAPGPGMSVYAGAKYGVRGFTLSAALELEAHGVAVTLVCPDRVETGLFQFPNASGPQAAVAWSGPAPMDPRRVAESIVRDVLTKKPLIYCLPRHRGFMARFSEMAPPSMLREMFAFLSAKGARRQREAFHLEAGTAAPSPGLVVSPPTPDSDHGPATRGDPMPAGDPVFECRGEEDVARCYAAAKSAASALRASGVVERLVWVARIKRHLVNNRDEIARRIALETGKETFEALVLEIMFVLTTIEFHLQHAERALRPEKVKGLPFQSRKRGMVHYEPQGVVLVLSPYNYPLALGLLPAIEAVIAGNATIVKPSERCPMASIWRELLMAANLPAGVLQVCLGGPEEAGKLIEAGPDRIHLTGGSKTGARVAELAARKLIPFSAELGGKDVAVVFEDADLERTIECLVWAFLLHAGQTCASIKRILVHENVYDRFCSSFARRVASLDSPANKGSTASLTWESESFRAERARVWIKEAVERGCRVLLPVAEIGEEWATGALRPIIVADVPADLALWQEETWGPLLALNSFRTEDQAIRLANDCRFGLGASVWSRDPACGRRVAAALEVGFVSVNNALSTMANPGLPYGGTKASGWGRLRGRLGLRAFCNIKSVVIDCGHDMEPFWRPYTAEKLRLFSDVLRGAFSPGWGGKWVAFKAAGRIFNLARRSSRRGSER